MYFFSWPAFFSIYLLQTDIWEESLLIRRCLEDHTGHIVGKPYNWLNSIWSKTWKALDEINPLWSLFNRVVKFIVSLLSLSSVHLFVCFPNSLKYSVTKKCEGLIKCHSHDRCYVFSFFVGYKDPQRTIAIPNIFF